MITESITVGKDTEYPLSGILTLPEDAAGPVPAVVMVHGSGSSDMDERVMKLTPFKDLAEGLAEKGVASIRYEKRTWAYSSKMSKMRITVKEETIDNALLAIEMLKNDERIDKDNIFILGHSQHTRHRESFLEEMARQCDEGVILFVGRASNTNHTGAVGREKADILTVGTGAADGFHALGSHVGIVDIETEQVGVQVVSFH